MGEQWKFLDIVSPVRIFLTLDLRFYEEQVKAMYAVIKTGGKQYRVTKGDKLEVEKLEGAEGASVTLGEVLLIGTEGSAKIGTPTVSGASVKATIVKQKKDDKIIVFKKKRRQNYRRKNGHRQNLTVLEITDIKG